MLRSLAATAVLSLLVSDSAVAASYRIDRSNSSITFSIRHMAINKVQGRFNEFRGSVGIDDGSDELSSLEGTIEAKSIDTNHENRDEHLRSADFFDVETHPRIRFTSKAIEKRSDDWLVTGDLSLHGVTREVSLPVVLLGRITDPWGNTRLGLEGELEIDRQDWGITWSETLDSGGLVVGNDVRIHLNLEAVRQ